MWLKLVNSFSILWCQALFGLNVLHLSKVNFLVPRMYLVKLHGTHFNYVLACISDMLMYSARYHILPWTFAHCIFSLFFFLVCCFSLYLYVCMYCTATTSWWIKLYDFNGFLDLAALLHGSQVVSVSQTLRHWTEGSTYVRQGDHHVGHWPTF